MIFNVRLRLHDGEKKIISHEDRNIRNNLVKFADNLPFSYLEHLKNKSVLMKNESNHQLNENI